MMMYGKPEPWQVTYYPRDLSKITLGVAIVAADCEQTAYQAFREQYEGQYSTIAKVEKLIK